MLSLSSRAVVESLSAAQVSRKGRVAAQGTVVAGEEGNSVQQRLARCSPHFHTTVRHCARRLLPLALFPSPGRKIVTDQPAPFQAKEKIVLRGFVWIGSLKQVKRAQSRAQRWQADGVEEARSGSVPLLVAYTVSQAIVPVVFRLLSPSLAHASARHRPFRE